MKTALVSGFQPGDWRVGIWGREQQFPWPFQGKGWTLGLLEVPTVPSAWLSGPTLQKRSAWGSAQGQPMTRYTTTGAG